jgi:hypothetical protein
MTPRADPIRAQILLNSCGYGIWDGDRLNITLEQTTILLRENLGRFLALVIQI